MAEVLSLHVGACGVRTGAALWPLLCQEHGLDPATGVAAGAAPCGRPSVHFEELASGRFVPRAVFADLDPGAVDHAVRGGPSGRLFSPDSIVTGRTTAGNNWAKGHYTDGAELIDPVMDTVRRAIERCDRCGTIQVTHALSGGCGSGFGALLLRKLDEWFRPVVVASYALYPSRKPDTVVAPYNAVLTTHCLIEESTATMLLDNESLLRNCQKRLVLAAPTLGDANDLVAAAMADLTAASRFTNQQTLGWRKLLSTVVPFPRMHFFTVATGILRTRRAVEKASEPVTAHYLADVNLKPGNQFLCDPPPRGTASPPAVNRMFTGTIFRGPGLSLEDAHTRLAALAVEQSWGYDCIATDRHVLGACNQSPVGADASATTLLADPPSIMGLFSRITDQFSAMHRRRAYYHWYAAEGMDDMEFVEAEANTRDAVAEYMQYDSGIVEDED